MLVAGKAETAPMHSNPNPAVAQRKHRDSPETHQMPPACDMHLRDSYHSFRSLLWELDPLATGWQPNATRGDMEVKAT